MTQSKNFNVQIDGANAVEIKLDTDLDLIKKKNGGYSLIYESKTYDVELLSIDLAQKELVLTLDGVKHFCQISTELDILIKKLGLSSSNNTLLKELRAPMPGKVIDILINNGDELKKGDSILILEAMKMENVIKAPHDLKIKEVAVSKNQAVEKGAVLVKL